MPLFGELRRRNIFKVSLAYAIVSWLIVQVADIILPAFSAPMWTMQVLILFLILAFPIAVLLAWAYELTPEGFKPTADVDRAQSMTLRTGQKLNHIVVVLLSVAVVFLVVDNYLLDEGEPPPDPDTSYRKSIAVLPFSMSSEGAEDSAFLADGLHDELLTRLSKISDLKVISKTSVMEYRDAARNLPEIGAALGVGTIVEGAVQRAGDSFRIIIQLIDARTDDHIWADTFDSDLTAADIFAMQTEIATAIAEELEAQLSDDEERRLADVPTENTRALEAYFNGRRMVEERTVESLLESIRQFEVAVALDNEFALAWAGMAEAWLELPNYSADVDHSKVRREAATAAIRAVRLAPESPEALSVLGWHLLLHNYDWEGAERAFRNALEIDANNVMALHWYSHLLSWQGKEQDAITAARLAVEADPLSAMIETNLHYILMDARRWPEADTVANRILARTEFISLLGNAWIGKLRERDAEEAAALLVRWAQASNRDVEAAAALGELIIRGQAMGEVVAIELEQIERAGIGTEVPEIYAAMGDAENTILALQRANDVGAGFRSLLSMKINPSYDFIRDDPRFQALLAEIGLAHGE